MYVSIEQVRAEALADAEATDERILQAIAQATALVDKVCGWFFEPRQASYFLSGTDSQTLELPVPPIRLETVCIGHEAYPGRAFETIGAPIADPKFFVPKLLWSHGRFNRGVHNVHAAGVWGYTVPSPLSRDGVTPAEIRRATLLLVRRFLPVLGSDVATQTRSDWRLVEERTRDQSYRMQAREDGPFSGDPEVDAILLRYRRPMALGAA